MSFVKVLREHDPMSNNRFITILCILSNFLITHTTLTAQQQILPDSILNATKDSLEKNYPLSISIIPTIYDTHHVAPDTAAFFGDIVDFNAIPGLNNLGSPFAIYNPESHYEAYGHGFKASLPHYFDFWNFGFVYPNKSLTDINYKQGRSILNSQTTFQNNYHLNLLFAHVFKNNVNFNLKYNKLNHEGIYQNQRQKHSALASGMRYQSKDEKFNLQIMYIWNLSKSEESNGISDDSLLALTNFRIRNSIPVFSAALKNIGEQQIGISYQQQFKSGNPLFNLALRLYHKYSEFRYAFTDNAPIGAQHQYRFFLVDSALLKINYVQDVLTNGIRMDLLQTKTLNLGIDLRYDYVTNDYDTALFHTNVFKFTAYSHLKFLPAIPIQLKYSLFQRSSRTAQMLDASFEYQHRDLGKLKLGWFLHQYYPTIIEERMFVNNIPIRDQNLLMPVAAGLEADLASHKKYLPKFQLRYSNYFNFIFYDTAANIQQRLSPMHGIEFEVMYALKWKWIFLQNRAISQNYMPDAFNLNYWFSEHQLGIQLHLFKKVLYLQACAYAQIRDVKKQLFFQSPTGILYPSNNDFHPYMSNGLRFQIRVLSFEAHLDLDHLDSFWNKKRPSIVALYPMFDFYLRLGLRWRLFY